MSENTKEKRVTKAQRYADIKAMLVGEDTTFGTSTEDALAFIDHEISLLSKKNASGEKKQTETQKQNEGYMAEIANYLAGVTVAGDDEDAKKSGKTCTEIQAAIPSLAGYQNQKISRLCNMLADAGTITGDTVKGKKLWRVVA